MSDKQLNILYPPKTKKAKKEGRYIDQLINELNEEAKQRGEFFYLPKK